MSLTRFVDAQAHVWPRPLEEIQAGRKTSHWMWFIFPQLRGLGRSPTARHYGIRDLPEARAYLAHPVLGQRLRAICHAMLAHSGTAPDRVLGSVDALKLRSCATLFQKAGKDPVFAEILDAFHEGRPCKATLDMLGQRRPAP